MVKETSALVKKLAHNDPVVRRTAFASLTNYLKSPGAQKLSLLELEKLWKGLYFSMWYCDKPVPQQHLAGDLGKLFSEVVPEENLKSFHRAFWAVMSREWYSIDKWRIDKFLMLVRRAVRHMIFRLDANRWPEREVDHFLDVLREYPLANNPKFPQSLAYHLCDIYVDEIEYVIFKDFRDYSEEVDEDDDQDEDGSEAEDDSNDDDEEQEESENGKTSKEHPKNALSPEQTAKAKKKILSAMPIVRLISPFGELAATAKNKAMRAKCTEEVLTDSRLIEWGVVEQGTSDTDTEDEWTGF